jgi:hypothetical protein
VCVSHIHIHAKIKNDVYTGQTHKCTATKASSEATRALRDCQKVARSFFSREGLFSRANARKGKNGNTNWTVL